MNSVLQLSAGPRDTRGPAGFVHLCRYRKRHYTYSLVSCSGDVCLYIPLTEIPILEALVGFRMSDSVKTATVCVDSSERNTAAAVCWDFAAAS